MFWIACLRMHVWNRIWWNLIQSQQTTTTTTTILHQWRFHADNTPIRVSISNNCQNCIKKQTWNTKKCGNNWSRSNDDPRLFTLVATFNDHTAINSNLQPTINVHRSIYNQLIRLSFLRYPRAFLWGNAICKLLIFMQLLRKWTLLPPHKSWVCIRN